MATWQGSIHFTHREHGDFPIWFSQGLLGYPGAVQKWCHHHWCLMQHPTELALPFTRGSTKESGPCTSPRQCIGAGLVEAESQPGLSTCLRSFMFLDDTHHIYILKYVLGSPIAVQLTTLYAVKIYLPIINPSHYLLCSIWSALSSNLTAHMATFYGSANPWNLSFLLS